MQVRWPTYCGGRNSQVIAAISNGINPLLFGYDSLLHKKCAQISIWAHFCYWIFSDLLYDCFLSVDDVKSVGGFVDTDTFEVVCRAIGRVDRDFVNGIHTIELGI